MDSWIAAAFESQGLWITIYSFLRDKWAFWNEFWCIYFPFELWMLIGDIQEAEDWKKQFISRLYMHYIPICHVANDHGANKEPDVHRWLKEVQLPGVFTHQVKLQGHSQKEGTFNSNHGFSRRDNGRKQLGMEKGGMKKKTTRKQALKNKIYNILKPTSAIHLIQIFPDLTEKLCLGKWLHNDIRTEWERRRIFEWKNKKAQRNVAFSSPMSAWNLEDAWSIVSFSYAKDYS